MEPFDPATLDHIWQASLGHQTWDGLNVQQTVRPPVQPYTEVDAILTDSDDTLELGELIGRGGLADVYSAIQHSLMREVAVKVIRRGSEVQPAARFAHEARINGGLNHPNILPVHGMFHSKGQPALVMKRVSGRSWAEQLRKDRQRQRDTLADHIEVLVRVCEAVEFAHSRGVLHLDLKPSNVMVGRFGEVLLMDWGCAVIFQDLHWSDQPDLPRAKAVRHPLGTPSYMPPELARGQGDQLGAHTDVYLLGATLYELLTGASMREGHTPRHVVQQACTGIRAPLPESVDPQLADVCQRALQSDVADRLATVRAFSSEIRGWLNTREARELTEEALTAVSELTQQALPWTRDAADRAAQVLGVLIQTGTGGAQLPSAIEGEQRLHQLIAQNALLRSEPGLARQHAEALPTTHPARDSLLADAQILQAKMARSEQVSRWFKRAVAALVVLAITTSVAIYTLYTQADRERQRAQAVSAFSSHMLSAIDPETAQGLDNRLMLKVLEEAARTAEARFEDQPQVLAEVLLNIAESYDAIERFDQAIPPATRSYQLLLNALGPDHPKTLRSELRVAILQREMGDLVVARDRIASIVKRAEVAEGPASALYLKALNVLGRTQSLVGRLDLAEEAFTQTLDGRRRLLGPEHVETLTTHANLVEVLLERNKLAEATALALDLVERSERTLPWTHPGRFQATLLHAQILAKSSQFEAALAEFDRVHATAVAVLSESHPEVLRLQWYRAEIAADQERFELAEAIHRGALTLAEPQLGKGNDSYTRHASGLMGVLSTTGRYDEAVALGRETAQQLRQAYGTNAKPTVEFDLRLARTLTLSGRLDEAVAHYEQTLPRLEEYTVIPGPTWATAQTLYADSLQRQGRLEEAVQHLVGALDAVAQRDEDPAGTRFTLEAKLGELHTFAGPNEDGARAEALLRSAKAGRSKQLGPHHSLTLRVDNRLGMLHLKRKQYPQAAEVFANLAAIRTERYGPDSLEVASALTNLAFTQNRLCDLEGAIEVYERVIQIRSARLSPDHESTERARRNKRITQQKAGLLTGEVPELRDSFERKRATLGPSHPETLEAQFQWGKSLAVAEKRKQAIPIVTEVLDARERDPNTNPAVLARTRAELGKVLLEHGEAAAALTHLEAAYRWYLTVEKLGPRHPSALHCAEHVVQALAASGDVERARAFQAEALRTARASTQFVEESEFVQCDGGTLMGNLEQALADAP